MSYNNLNEMSERIAQPLNLKIQLMEHQKTAVHAMKNIEKTGLIKAENITQYGEPMNFNIETCIGILADKVGSGKSLMVVSLIDIIKKIPNRDIYWTGSKFISIKSTTHIQPLNINLLLIPHKLMSQWINFFKYAPNIKLITYKDIEDEKKINIVEDLIEADVIIVSCTKTKTFFQKFKDIKWNRIFVDEADSIKLPNNTIFNASFVWLITATPKSLRYSNKTYLVKTFKEITPWVFDYLIVKNDFDFIDKSIILPIPKRIVINCLTPRELNLIKSFLPKNILSMINAGNTNEAIKLLNCNVNTNDNILKVITNNLLNAVNNKKIELECELKKKFKENSKAKLEQDNNIKKINKYIERLEIKYNSIKEKIYNLNDQYCPICMDEFNNPTLANCCQNIFCFECITLSSQNGLCPHCRKKIYKEDLHIISSTPKNISQSNFEKKEKLDVLIELIQNNPTGKFLVFANFPQTFDKIKIGFRDKNISFKILKGTNNLVQKTINNFSNGLINVIMLNAKFFGAGMNLQMATHIIIYHRFDNDTEEQVIGRAQRLGRTDSLNVFYLIHDNETNSFDNKDKFEEIDYNDWFEYEINNEN